MSFTYSKPTHSYHLVDSSPWPIISTFVAFILTVGGVLYMHKFNGGWGSLTLNSDINYAESTSFTPNGTFGIKVWTYS